MTYELALDYYRGPLEKLLELIEERKLEISRVSLAQVTDDFLRYLQTVEKVPASLLADFIVVASRLIFLKSKSLLPDLTLTAEEEAEISDLEFRLRLYQELKPAMKVMQHIWRNQKPSYGRPYLYGMQSGKLVFYPGTSLTIQSLAASLGKLVATFEKLQLETEVIKQKIVTIEEKMKEVLGRLTREGNVSFQSFSKRRPSSEIIALFLAVLHLARDEHISLEQEAPFSDILITSRTL